MINEQWMFPAIIQNKWLPIKFFTTYIGLCNGIPLVLHGCGDCDGHSILLGIGCQ